MLEKQIIGGAAHLFHGYKAYLSREFIRRDLPFAASHYRVIRSIPSLQPCTAQTLARHLRRDKAQVTRLIQDLENKSIIERTPNPEDKRSQLLTLTRLGRKTLEQMAAAEKQVLAEVLRGLSKEDIKTFVQLLAVINRNLDTEA